MNIEQLQAAYMAGRAHIPMDKKVDYDMRKHLAGLAEVARQAAEVPDHLLLTEKNVPTAGLLLVLQEVKLAADVRYRGHLVHVDKVDDAPPLLYVTVSGWDYALHLNGQSTVHALAGIRDIDQLIDILDNTSGKGN